MTDRRPIPPQTLSRLRELADTYAADPSKCDWCEGDIPGSRRRDARTCSEACRKALSRDRKDPS